MVRQHFKDASQRPQLSHFETGFHGAPTDVMLAVDAIDDQQQAPLQLMEIAMGAKEAMAQGRPENIQAFFSHNSNAAQYDAYILSQLVTGITFCQLRMALRDMPSDRKLQAISDTRSLLSSDPQNNHDAALRRLETAANLPVQDFLKLKNG